MDKVSLLDSVAQAAADRVVTRDELIGAFDRGTTMPPEMGFVTTEPVTVPSPVAEQNHHLNSSEVFYYIGGAIVFIGIAILVGGSWETLPMATKLLATLGSGTLAYILGAYFIKEERWGKLSSAFFLISALVLPIGLFTAYGAAGFNTDSTATLVLITAILTTLFSASYWFYRKAIFTIFAIIFGTGLFVSSMDIITGGNPVFGLDFHLYQLLIIGLAYLLFGYQFSTSQINSSLTGSLYSFGSIAFFGAALGLGGFQPNQNIIWELVFPLLVAAEIALGIRLKSRSLLIWGSIFLMGYILKITGEYFSEGLGWPLALVIAGLSLIGLGYYIFYLNRKYLTQ